MNPEQKRSNPRTVDPEIQDLITFMLDAYKSSLTRAELAKFTGIEDEGEQIDNACIQWGIKGDMEQNAKLKALRLVRKFSRRIYESAEEERAFDFPLIGDHKFWKTVDEDFMQYLDLQAKNTAGQYHGAPDYSAYSNGMSEAVHIATIADKHVFKAAIVLDGEPIHVYYGVSRTD